jgi:hypothetical protein
MKENILAFLIFALISFLIFKYLLDSSFKNNGSIYYNKFILMFIATIICCLICLVKIFVSIL